jgi:hypothetical protein
LAPWKRRPPESACRARYLEHEFAAVTQQRGPSGSAERSVGEDISDIVKRECGRQARESVCPAVMFGKHTVIGSETI